MLITADFMKKLEELIREADDGVRLTAKTNKLQKESSMRPVYVRLKTAETDREDITWDPTIKDLVTRIPAAKQMKYSKALKYLEKALMNQQSKIFSTLRKRHGVGELSEKLSKSQQRYTIPMVTGDAGGGLCAQMALLWLEEQLRTAPGPTRFPRLADEDVIGSPDALAVTRDAFELQKQRSLDAQAKARGLELKSTWLAISFSTADGILKKRKEKAYFIAFHESHGIGLVRESSEAWLFYDANAGSYRVPKDNLQEFLVEYNNVCLPKKWTGYSSPDTHNFDGVLSVTKAAPKA